MDFFTGTIKSVFYVKNLPAVADYYGDVYGLPVVNTFPEGCDIQMLGNGYIQLRTDTTDIPQGPGSLWIEALDVDRVFAEVSQHPKANIFESVEDKYYHARVYRAIDPAGNAMAVVEYEKDLGIWQGPISKGSYFNKEFRSVMFVDDLDACHQFYTQTLGMKCVYSWDEGPGDRGFKYQLRPDSDAYLEILHRIPLMPQGKVTIELGAKDAAACFAELKDKPGITMLDELQTDSQGKAFFRMQDPDGNALLIRGC